MVLKNVNAFAYFLRVQRGAPTGNSSSSPKALNIIPEQMFSSDEYYAWFYEGSQWTTYAGGVLMVVIMLAGVMFPLWPPVMRLGVWYLSIAVLGLIGLFFVIAILRLIFYIITIIVASPGIWIFPQLFADVGFVRVIKRHMTNKLNRDNHLYYRSTPLYLSGSGIFPRKSQRRRKATRKRKGNRQARNARTMGQSLKKSRIRRQDDHAWKRSRMKMRRLYIFMILCRARIQCSTPTVPFLCYPP